MLSRKVMIGGKLAGIEEQVPILIVSAAHSRDWRGWGPELVQPESYVAKSGSKLRATLI